MNEVYKPGDTVTSFNSWTRLKIAKVDSLNRYYIDADGRAVKFSECQLCERAAENKAEE